MVGNRNPQSFCTRQHKSPPHKLKINIIRNSNTLTWKGFSFLFLIIIIFFLQLRKKRTIFQFASKKQIFTCYRNRKEGYIVRMRKRKYKMSFFRSIPEMLGVKEKTR